MIKIGRLFIIYTILSIVLLHFSVTVEAGEKRQLIIINKSTNKLAFFEEGAVKKVFSVATGRKVSYTPEGKFKIVKKIKNRPYYKKGIPGGSLRNPLGDRWLGLNARGTWGNTYGIHGNNNSKSIGTYASAGCVRMHNKEVRWLYDRVGLNTTVFITRSKKSFSEIAESIGYKRPKSSDLKQSLIKVTNNKGKADTIEVKSIKKGDVIRVYNQRQKGKPIATKKSKGSKVKLSVQQIGKQAGKLYVSIIRVNKTESNRIVANYKGEQSDPLKETQIQVINNIVEPDLIIISGVRKEDVIRVYSPAHNKPLVVIGPIKDTNISISVKQLGETAGYIYITVTKPKMLESNKLKIMYPAEEPSSNTESVLE